MQVLSRIKNTAYDVSEIIKDSIRSPYWSERPQSLNFEITAACDSRCIHCPRLDMDRPMRPMNFDLFKKLIDEAAEMKIPYLCPNGYGEILTIPNLGDYLEYISSKEYKFKVIINTNAHRLFEDKIELFIKHKIHLLNICIDGATAETAQSIRIGLKTPQIEENIHNVMAIRKQRHLNFPQIRVAMVIIPQNEHEVEQFSQKWKGVVDFVGFSGFSNRLGSLNNKFNVGEFGNNTPACVLPFKDMNIWADGRAVLCCEDWNQENVVGDLKTQSLKEIWHGPELTEARRLHIQGQGAQLEICKNCNLWRQPSAGAKLWS
ncbi:radical SAM/SPASM domain-containing protein [Floridanema evergladense]|uniref:Radical SAM/SPASM domain-containing protein n=1 Tax=Floridaenema evergladense BLCC-F167 TaxID=3153639 RepID=A0ABV4WFF9_9CYAN